MMRDDQIIDTKGPPVRQSATAIEQDLHCLNCSYNLRGLSPDGNCPECNAPITESEYHRHLSYSDPTWLARVQRGVAMLSVYPLAWYFAHVLDQSGGIWVVKPAALTLLVVGATSLSSSEPRKRMLVTGNHRARICRYASGIACLFGLLSTVAMHSKWGWTGNVVGAVFHAFVITTGVSAMHLCHQLTQRIPEKNLAKWCGRATVAFPIVWAAGLIRFLLPNPWIIVPTGTVPNPNNAWAALQALSFLGTSITHWSTVIVMFLGAWMYDALGKSLRAAKSNASATIGV